MGILSFILMACLGAGFAQDYEDNSFIRFGYHFVGDKILNLGVFDNKVPSFDDIARDQYRFNTYEQFIDYLLAQAPSLKHTPVMLHHSQSLQLSSFDHPRILLFDGGSVFAFAEDPTNKTRRVEIAEVDPETFAVSLREISFGPRGAEFNAKPTSCTACHGSPAKLIWDPYDFWPNTYGASVGRVNSVMEDDFYQKIRTSKAHSPLLAKLPLPTELIIGKEGNTPFTQYVGMLNQARWITQGLKGKDLSAIQYPMLATLSFCFQGFGGQSEDYPVATKSFLEYFPPGNIQQSSKTELDLIYADTTQARIRFTDYQDKLYLNQFPDPEFRNKIDHKRLGYETLPISYLRWLFANAGVDMSNFSTSFIANDLFIAEPGNFQSDLLTSLYKLRPDLFEGLTVRKITLGTPEERWIRLECDELKAKSLARNSALNNPVWTSSLKDQPSRPAFTRCAKCHVEGANSRAPYIPFQDQSQFREALLANNGQLAEKILFRIQTPGPGRMPYRSKPLTAEEITAVRDFITTIRE